MNAAAKTGPLIGAGAGGEGHAAGEGNGDERDHQAGGRRAVEGSEQPDRLPTGGVGVDQPEEAAEGAGQPHHGVGRYEDAHHGQALRRRRRSQPRRRREAPRDGRRLQRPGTGHVARTSTDRGSVSPSNHPTASRVSVAMRT
jgi:hypothetical protein